MTLKPETSALLIGGAFIALLCLWEPEVINAVGRTLLRLIPLAIAAWLLVGAFENQREKIGTWIKGLAVVAAAFLVVWTFFLWGDVGDYVFGHIFGPNIQGR
jgi:hypothetical protein